jgi:hypothetical protein
MGEEYTTEEVFGPPLVANFEDFWPGYLGEHRHPLNRLLHVVGTTLALALILGLSLAGLWTWTGLAAIIGYGFAWIGHVGIEKNRPASFRHPLYSLRADLRMWALACTGRLERELHRQGIIR